MSPGANYAETLTASCAPLSITQMRLVRQLSFAAASLPGTMDRMRTAEERTERNRLRDNVIRVVIVDDHVMFREGIKSLLAKSPIDVVGEPPDGPA